MVSKPKKQTPESPTDWARRTIKAGGYFVKSIERIFPPLEHLGGEAEVWFFGRAWGEGDAPVERLTAYIPDDPNAAALIATGW